MKRLLVYIIPLLTVFCASAQTYKNGIWYSYYDDSEHTMNTISSYEINSNIFAPTDGSFSFTALYTQGNWAWSPFRVNTTNVYQSSNGKSATSLIGTIKNNTWEKSEDLTYSIEPNINYIKFDRPTGNTYNVVVSKCRMVLSKHILLASGTYGTTSKSYDFGELEALSTSAPYSVQLRSFLSAGDITITSSAPEIFHVGTADNTLPLTYNVGNNACASANGTAQAAAGGTLGNIANYAFDVYFTPKAGQPYSATITISDGVSTATITLTGSGKKLNQEIIWEQQTLILSDGTIALAQASSGLDVTYSFAPEGKITFENGEFKIKSEGAVSVTASQEGNEVYNAAESVTKEFTIFPAVTNYMYTQFICEGDAYSDEYFTNISAKGLHYDTVPSAWGGKTIICLTLDFYEQYHFEQTNTIQVGTSDTWQNIDLSTLPVGDTTLVAKYQTIDGCDSVYTLQLTVKPKPVTYGNDTAWICAGETLEYAGKTFKRQAIDSVVVPEPNQFGGDSIVELVVRVFPLMKMQSTRTIEEGLEETWQNIDLSTLPAGDTTLVAVYSSVNGCDSTFVLKLTVKPKIATDINNTEITDIQQKILINGQLYIRKGDAWFDIMGKKVR